MDNALVQAQITEQLIRKLEASRFLHIPLMNRIEERLRTKEELERYIAMLVHKLEETDFRHEWLINRIDSQMERHQKLERAAAAAT